MAPSQAACRALYQAAGTKGYFSRSLFGGKYDIKQVIEKGPNCIDYSFALKYLLKKYYNITGKIKETKLVLINNHQYFLTENNEALDLIVGIKEYPDGYFNKKEIYLNQINKINQQGKKIIFQQIKAILFPGTRKKLC